MAVRPGNVLVAEAAFVPFYVNGFAVNGGSKYQFDRDTAAAVLGYKPKLFSTFRRVGNVNVANFPAGIPHPHGFSHYQREVSSVYMRNAARDVRAAAGGAARARRIAVQHSAGNHGYDEPALELPVNHGRVLEISESLTRSTWAKDGATRCMRSPEDWARWARSSVEPRAFANDAAREEYERTPRSNAAIGDAYDDVYNPANYDLVIIEDAYFHAEPADFISMLTDAPGVQFIVSGPAYRRDGVPRAGTYMLGEHEVFKVPGKPHHVRVKVRDPSRNDGAYPEHWAPWLRAGTYTAWRGNATWRRRVTITVRAAVALDTGYDTFEIMCLDIDTNAPPWQTLYCEVEAEQSWQPPNVAMAEVRRAMALAVSGAHSSTDKGRKQIAFRAGYATDAGQRMSADEMTRLVACAMEDARRANEDSMRADGRLIPGGVYERLLARLGWDCAREASAKREAAWRGCESSTQCYVEHAPTDPLRFAALAVLSGALPIAAIAAGNALLSGSALRGMVLIYASHCATSHTRVKSGQHAALLVTQLAVLCGAVYARHLLRRNFRLAAVSVGACSAAAIGAATWLACAPQLTGPALAQFPLRLARRNAPVLGAVREGVQCTLKPGVGRGDYFGYVELGPRISINEGFTWHTGDASNLRAGLSRSAFDLARSDFAITPELYEEFAVWDEKMADVFPQPAGAGWREIRMLEAIIDDMPTGSKKLLYERIALALESGTEDMCLADLFCGLYTGTAQIKHEQTFKEKVRLIFGDSLLAVLLEMPWWDSFEKSLGALGCTYVAGRAGDGKSDFLARAEEMLGADLLTICVDGVKHDGHRQPWWSQLAKMDFERYTGQPIGAAAETLRRVGGSHHCRGVGAVKMTVWALVMWLSGLRGTYAHNSRVTRFLSYLIKRTAGVPDNAMVVSTTGDDVVLMVQSAHAGRITAAVMDGVSRGTGYEMGLEHACIGVIGAMYAGSVAVRLDAKPRLKPDPLRLWDRIGGAAIRAPCEHWAAPLALKACQQRLDDMALARGCGAGDMPVFWAYVKLLQDRARAMGHDFVATAIIDRDGERAGVSRVGVFAAREPSEHDRQAYAEAWGVDCSLQRAIESDILDAAAGRDWGRDLTHWDHHFRSAVMKRRAEQIRAAMW